MMHSGTLGSREIIYSQIAFCDTIARLCVLRDTSGVVCYPDVQLGSFCALNLDLFWEAVLVILRAIWSFVCPKGTRAQAQRLGNSWRRCTDVS